MLHLCPKLSMPELDYSQVCSIDSAVFEVSR